MIGQAPHVLAEASPVVHDVQGEPELPGEPLQVRVEAGRLPVGVGEDGAVRHAVERPLARHERHHRGLNAAAETDDRQALHCRRASRSTAVGMSLSGHIRIPSLRPMPSAMVSSRKR